MLSYFLDEATNTVEFHYIPVAMNYLKTWFVLDLVSGIPYDMIASGGGVSDLAQIRTIKILKGGRILKVSRWIQ